MKADVQPILVFKLGEKRIRACTRRTKDSFQQIVLSKMWSTQCCLLPVPMETSMARGNPALSMAGIEVCFMASASS